jgi:hypothetical protein
MYIDKPMGGYMFMVGGAAAPTKDEKNIDYV